MSDRTVFPQATYTIHLERQVEDGWRALKTLGAFEARDAAIACAEALVGYYATKGGGPIRALILRTESIICTHVTPYGVVHCGQVPGDAP